jgi:hypothetical protein
VAAWQAPKVINAFGRLAPPPRFRVAFDGTFGEAFAAFEPVIGVRALCEECNAAIAAAPAARERAAVV